MYLALGPLGYFYAWTDKSPARNMLAHNSAMSLHSGGVTLAKRLRHRARGLAAKRMATDLLSAMRAQEDGPGPAGEVEVHGDGDSWTRLGNAAERPSPGALELGPRASALTGDLRVAAIQTTGNPPGSWSSDGTAGPDELTLVRRVQDAGASEVLRVSEACNPLRKRHMARPRPGDHQGVKPDACE